MAKWIIKISRKLEKSLQKLPIEIGRIFENLIVDLENEGPFPKGWQIGHLAGRYKGYLKVRLKREYRAIYRYESKIITIHIEKVAHRKESY